MKTLFILIILATLVSFNPLQSINNRAEAHSGRTDKCGCHHNRKTGEYHCHNRKQKGGDCPL